MTPSCSLNLEPTTLKIDLGLFFLKLWHLHLWALVFIGLSLLTQFSLQRIVLHVSVLTNIFSCYLVASIHCWNHSFLPLWMYLSLRFLLLPSTPLGYEFVFIL